MTLALAGIAAAIAALLADFAFASLPAAIAVGGSAFVLFLYLVREKSSDEGAKE